VKRKRKDSREGLSKDDVEMDLVVLDECNEQDESDEDDT
jgi:hypothetical protein